MTRKYEAVITPREGEPFTDMIEASNYNHCLDKISRKHGACSVRVVDIWVGDKPERPTFQFGPHFDKEPLCETRRKLKAGEIEPKRKGRPRKQETDNSKILEVPYE